MFGLIGAGEPPWKKSAKGARILTAGGVGGIGAVRDVAQVLVRAALGKPRRNLATTRRGALGLFVARHFPALVDPIVESDFRRLIAGGISLTRTPPPASPARR